MSSIDDWFSNIEKMVSNLNLQIYGLTFTVNQVFAFIVGLISLFIFFIELRKWTKYHSSSDLMELSFVLSLASFSYFMIPDVLLPILVGICALMIIGTYEIRESYVWFRLMVSFTATYLVILIAYIVGEFILKDPRIFGLAWNFSFWVLLIVAFLFFGKKFLLVSRFMSPTYVYVILYFIAYIFILQLGLDLQYTYIAVIIVNFIVYLFSGVLLRFLFGVKRVTDPAIIDVVNKVGAELGVKVREVGLVQAPILNAFAYGPWFDQRIAFITDDLSAYKPEELKGIIAHELAHLKKKHTLWLLVLTAVELIIKWLLGAPATFVDFALRKNTGWQFFDFYILNLVIFIILLIFVRIMEAQADRVTIELGLGKNLAFALYHLEGFYYGIAGDLGLNAQLLTGRKREKDEKIRFLGEAAETLYRHLIAAPRLSLAMNLIVSHPPTAYRIAAILNPKKIGIFKLAVYPLILMLPKVRNRYLTELQQLEKEFDQMLTEKFLADGYSIQDFLNVSYDIEYYHYLLGKHVIALPLRKTEHAHIGILEKIEPQNSIINPIYFHLKNPETGEISQLPYGKYKWLSFSPNDTYILLDKNFYQLVDVNIKKDVIKGFKYKSHNDKIVVKKYLGFSLSELTDTNANLFLYTHGTYIPVTMDVQLKDDWKSTKIELKPLNPQYLTKDFLPATVNTEKLKLSYYGKDLILIKDNFFFHGKNLKAALDALQQKNMAIQIYTKDDPEIGIPGTLISFDKKENTLTINCGNFSTKTISLKKIDAFFLLKPNVYLLEPKNETTLVSTKLSKLFDRKKITKSILALL